MYLTDLRFKYVFDALSSYLLREHPPKCLLEHETVFVKMSGNIWHKVRNEINFGLTGGFPLSDSVVS